MKKILTLALFAMLAVASPVLAENAPPAVGAEVVETVVAVAEEVPAVDSGDTAWMITATALVLFMTLPGLALFYGGLVRAKNVLTILVQCFSLASIITVLWVAYGYSVVEMHGQPMRCDLKRLYSTYQQTPDRLDDIVAAHLAALGQVPAPAPPPTEKEALEVLPAAAQPGRLAGCGAPAGRPAADPPAFCCRLDH